MSCLICGQIAPFKITYRETGQPDALAGICVACVQQASRQAPAVPVSALRALVAKLNRATEDKYCAVDRDEIDACTDQLIALIDAATRDTPSTE